MRVLLMIFFAGFVSNCSDGDLQIETIDFDAASVQFCESAVTVSSRIFFKINGDEALILNLQSGVLKNEASAGAISSTVPGQSQITYRIFSGTVSKNYFCDAIPPSTPVVIEEITASAGEVLISTVQSATDSTAFVHTVELSGISLVNTRGERITDLSINEFGTVTTKN